MFNKDFIFICGNTKSNNLKITANAYQKTYKSGYDGFVIKFMVNSQEPTDVLTPVIISQSDSCGSFREIIVTDEQIDDMGIKSADIIKNDNCNIQIDYIKS